jgi:hypothetical protein
LVLRAHTLSIGFRDQNREAKVNSYLRTVGKLAGMIGLLYPLSMLGGTTEGGAIRACVHKNSGALRIISANESCNSKNENLLTWSSGVSSATPRVVDSKGAEVGVSRGGDVVIREVEGGVWVEFFAFSAGVRQEVAFGYKSTDCTGTRYMSLAVDLPVDGAVLGNTIYYPAIAGVEYFSLGSAQVFDANGLGPCVSGSSIGPFGPVVEAPFPSFTPPLRVSR